MHWIKNERGVALVTVLVFMVIMLILVTTMLTVTGNEILIAGLQRDSAEALDHAQAGLEEGVRRIEGGRAFATPFAGSLASGINVQVLTRQPGPSASILEIQSDAAVGRARRRLSVLALAVPRMGLPNIVFGENCTSQGTAVDIARGNIYCQTFVSYADWPPDINTLTYAGWRVSRGCNPNNVDTCGGASNQTQDNNQNQTHPCYNYLDCVNAANNHPKPSTATDCAGPVNQRDGRCRDHPGVRRAIYLNSSVGSELETIRANPPSGCNAASISGNAPLPANAIRAENPAQTPDAVPYLTYGFDRDDTVVTVAADGTGSLTTLATPQAVITSAWDPDGPDGPLPAWSFPCGIPYKYVQDPSAKREDGSSLNVYFKTVVFEHWFGIYWKLDGLELKPRNGSSCIPGTTACLPTNVEPNLVAYPDFGAVPPFVDFNSLKSSAQQVVTSTSGGETLNAGDPGIDWGNCDPITTCGTGPTDDPQIILLQCQPPTPCLFTVNNNDDNTHGLLLVDGDLNLNGGGTYYGTIIVNGNVRLGSGNFTVYGGVVAQSTSYLTGKLTVYAGGTVTNPVIGPAVVTGLSWWER